VTLGHIATKARALVHSQDSIYSADHTANDASDNGSYWPCRTLSFARAAFNATGHPLREG
jgi:uncharacterized protein YfaQ (DUF2300 family)